MQSFLLKAGKAAAAKLPVFSVRLFASEKLILNFQSILSEEGKKFMVSPSARESVYVNVIYFHFLCVFLTLRFGLLVSMHCIPPGKVLDSTNMLLSLSQTSKTFSN